MVRKMAGKITQAKYRRPVVGAVLNRERLFTVLDESRIRPAVWVSGQAGAGKTTLVSSYLEQRSLSHLWYRIDDTDSDIATFFHNLGEGIKQAFLDSPFKFPPLTPEYLPALHTFARKYFRKLFGSFSEPFSLVLDNCHEPSASSLFHELVKIAIEEVPEGGNLILISRWHPPAEYSALLSTKQLRVIEGATLSFTPTETTDMLRVTGSREFPPEIVQKMHEYTHGWAAGLILIQELFEKHQDVLGVGDIAHSSGPIFDYFAGELFRQIEPQVQEFLLQTSFLPEIPVDVAESLTGHDNAGDILAGLYKRNLFTERDGIAGAVYRYHALFQTFLRTQAIKYLSSGQVEDIKQKAADALIQTGRAEEAIPLLQQCCDWRKISSLILSQAPIVVEQGRYETLQGWLVALPDEEVLGKNPDLLFWLGISHLPFDPAQARNQLEQALDLFEQQNNRVGTLTVWPLIVDSYLIEWGDWHGLDKWIDWSEEAISPDQVFPSAQLDANASFAMLTALWARRPNHPRLPVWVDRCEKNLLVQTDPNQQVNNAARMAQYFTTTGDFARGFRILRSVEYLVDVDQVSPLSVVNWYSIRSMYSWLTAEEGGNQTVVDKAIDVADTTGVRVMDFLTLGQGVFGALAEGETERAQKLLNKMEPLLLPSRLLDGSTYHMLSGWHQILLGNLSNAREHMDVALARSQQAGMPFGQLLSFIGRTHAYHESGDIDEATNSLRNAWGIAKAMRSDHLKCACLLIRAYILYGQQLHEEGSEALTTALKLARKKGFVNFPFWRRKVMSALCEEALGRGIEVEFVRDLIRRRKLIPSHPDRATDLWPWPVRIFTLGKFQLTVNGGEVQSGRKPKRKQLELLRALVSLGAEGVPVSKLTDYLWPEVDGDQALKSFDVTLYRLRELLEKEPILSISNRTASLDRQCCWVDIWAFDRWLTVAKAAKENGEKASFRNALKNALDIYSGPFFPADMDQPWSINTREKYRTKYIQAVISLGSTLMAADECDQALAVYENALTLEPLSEELYRRAVEAYKQLGRHQDAQAMVERCERTFESELGDGAFSG